MSAAAAPHTPAPAARYARLWPLGRSLAINILGPYLVYRLLEAAFPSPSLIPLLGAAAVPAVALLAVFARRRVIDAVAVISISQLSAGLLISLVAHDPHASLVGHACQPALQGLVFALSVLIGRPLMIPLARQTMAGDDLERQARFDAIAARPDARRRFAMVTLAWTAALSLQTGVQLIALRHLSSSGYILFANVFGYGLTAALIWASIRYGRAVGRRMRAQAESTLPRAD